MTCCIQIETREALEDLALVLAVPGVDAVLIGPNDLAAALGHIGDLGHEEVEAAIAHVQRQAHEAVVNMGNHWRRLNQIDVLTSTRFQPEGFEEPLAFSAFRVFARLPLPQRLVL